MVCLWGRLFYFRKFTCNTTLLSDSLKYSSFIDYDQSLKTGIIKCIYMYSTERIIHEETVYLQRKMYQGLRWPLHHERVKINDMANVEMRDTSLYLIILWGCTFIWAETLKTETQKLLLYLCNNRYKMASKS